MKIRDIVKLSLNNLSHRGMRSWLTILGIVIGVAAVVAILSMGAGLQQSISSQLGGLGTDILTVSPGFSRAAGTGFQGFGGGERASTQSQNLTIRDLQIIKTVPGVGVVNGIISGRADTVYLAETVSASIRGVDPLAWKEITTSSLDSGRYLAPGDGNSVVVGYNIANTVFKQPLRINTQISIGGKSFNIVGILQASGGISGLGGDDSAIYMPITAARTVITSLVSNQFSSIQIKVADATAIDQTTSLLSQRLMLSRHVTNSTVDFTITSAAAIQQTLSSVIGTLSLFIGGIAAISLLVGAVGIANTMYMSVLERTKQIGTLKALGTTNSEIMKMFLIESAMIGFIGGLIGVFLGLIASGTLSEIGFRLTGASGRAGAGASATVVSPELVLFAMGFSVLIGMISGFLPARSAAKLQPVEALRYE